MPYLLPDVAEELAKTFEDCDFAGFNSNKFDYPILVEEFLRVGVDFNSNNRKFVRDAMRIFHSMEPRNLTAAYKFYCDKDLVNALTARKPMWKLPCEFIKTTGIALFG